MSKILIIEDEASIRKVLAEIISDEKDLKAEVEFASDGKQGLSLLEQNQYDVVFCDVKMPGIDGMEVLKRAKESENGAAFIMISAHGTTELAVDAIRLGAYDFLQKPPDINRLLITLRNALDRTELVKETSALRKKVSKKYEMTGTSAALMEVQKIIEKAAPTDARVLIMGPNGSGKELVARALHEKSPRSSKAFIEVNCAAIPPDLIESELFGHEKGSFTSAIKQRQGKFELADGGTIFLDEIGDMSLSAQAKVLRALQEKKITRVGGDQDINVNVRVVAATNKDLRKEIAENRFREDLFHRLGVIVVNVPPLSERKEDIPLLVQRFLDEIAKEQGTKPKAIEKGALKALEKHPWPGNIRELRNVMERLMILGGDPIIIDDINKYL
ncbi:MAG: sigma-54-dependent Fis family transcriptional regulator [Bacteroidetes bacterium]|nr:sigma-54-dependent Fis family transcriptional regulator [Bacteroidota bacterium]